MSTSRHIFYICILTTVYISQQCKADYTDLSEYMNWIDHQNINAALPSDIKNALFTYHFRSFNPITDSITPHPVSNKYKARQVSSWTRDSIKFTISYLKELRRTLVIDFLGSTSLYDACVDLQQGYKKIQLFNLDDDESNYITVHSGIITALFSSKFIDRFELKLNLLFDEIVKNGDTVSNLIIGGHSMGGALAQAFYFLLHGHNIHVPKSITMLRSNIEWLKVTDMHQMRHKITVITTGAFLILPNKDNYITDHKVGIVQTDRIINLIKRKDPVPMVFGGNIIPKIVGSSSVNLERCSNDNNVEVIKQLLGRVKKSYYEKKLGTATTVGRYYIIYKDESSITKTYRDYQKVRGIGNGYDDRFEIRVKVKLLIDGSSIGVKGNNEYLTKHLKEGSALLPSKIFAIPGLGYVSQELKELGTIHFGDLIFAHRFVFNHNEYFNDIESYICNDPYYEQKTRDNYQHPEIALLLNLHKHMLQKGKDMLMSSRNYNSAKDVMSTNSYNNDRLEKMKEFEELERLIRYISHKRLHSQK